MTIPYFRPTIPFFKPAIGEAEIQCVLDVLRGGWLTTGPRVREFEEAFAAFLGPDVETVAVNSATAGLHLALEACGVGPGDEVIVPTLTFTATAEVVYHVGARVVLVDVDPVTMTLDLAAAARVVTARTRAILPVHFGGRLARWETSGTSPNATTCGSSRTRPRLADAVARVVDRGRTFVRLRVQLLRQ